MIFRDFLTLPDLIDSFTHINLNLCSCLPLVMYIDENQLFFWEDCGRKVDFWAREWAFLTKLTFFRQIEITRKDCQTTHDHLFSASYFLFLVSKHSLLLCGCNFILLLNLTIAHQGIGKYCKIMNNTFSYKTSFIKRYIMHNYDHFPLSIIMNEQC